MTQSAGAALTRYERLRGLLLGGAVGDALGAPIEFMRREAILARYGPRGLTSFVPAYGRAGAITDDTQMTLFTLEGLIRANVRWSQKGICSVPAVIGHAYARWLATQEGARGDQKLDGWLISVPELWSARAPGMTCLSALRAKSRDLAAPAVNDSKGAGGIMRVGPIGLLAPEQAYELGRDAAALTHGHVAGSVSAGWFAAWMAELGTGAAPALAATRAWDQCRGQAQELDRALTRSFELASQGSLDAVPKVLGEGWVAEEAAAIALWCVLGSEDPMEALRLAVNIDGDSDTTGSLVGQALGALLGAGWIPSAMLAQLELKDVIDTLASDAGAVFSGRIDLNGPDGQRFWERYPGW